MGSHNLLKSLTNSQTDGIDVEGKLVLIKEGEPNVNDTGYMTGAIGINTIVYTTTSVLTIESRSDDNSNLIWCNCGTPTAPDWRGTWLYKEGCKPLDPPNQHVSYSKGKYGCYDYEG